MQIVHDLKNQINGLKLYATFLRRRIEKSERPSDEQETIAKLINGLDRAADDLSAIVKYGQPVELKKQPDVEVDKILRGVCASVNESGSRIVVTHRDCRDRVPNLENVAVVTIADADGASLRPGDLDSHEVIAAQSADCDPVPCSRRDAAVILYTSGSTGEPKGVAIAAPTNARRVPRGTRDSIPWPLILFGIFFLLILLRGGGRHGGYGGRGGGGGFWTGLLLGQLLNSGRRSSGWGGGFGGYDYGNSGGGFGGFGGGDSAGGGASSDW